MGGSTDETRFLNELFLSHTIWRLKDTALPAQASALHSWSLFFFGGLVAAAVTDSERINGPAREFRISLLHIHINNWWNVSRRLNSRPNLKLQTSLTSQQKLKCGSKSSPFFQCCAVPSIAFSTANRVNLTTVDSSRDHRKERLATGNFHGSLHSIRKIHSSLIAQAALLMSRL